MYSYINQKVKYTARINDLNLIGVTINRFKCSISDRLQKTVFNVDINDVDV